MALTDAKIKAAKAPASGVVSLGDGNGLSLRVTANDARIWTFQYRVGKRVRKMKLGRYPEVGLKKARERAAAARKLLSDGIDPQDQAASLKDVPNVKEVIAEFIERYAKPRNRSWKESERILKREVESRWGNWQITEIEPRHVTKLLDDIVDRGAPVMANRTLAQLRMMLNWCISRHMIDDNPCRRISAPSKEVSRNRVLSDEELVKVWQATHEMTYPTGPYFRLLILTAQREKEVAHMRWSDIDLERKTWTIPAKLAKNNQEHVVPLSDMALEELGKLPRAGDYVVSRSLGAKPFNGFSVDKKRLDELSGTSGWRIHDIRRTVATGMARAGVDRFIIKRVLNHVDRDVTGIYDRHGYYREKGIALSRWEDFINAIMKA